MKKPKQSWRDKTKAEIDQEYAKGKRDAEQHSKVKPSPYIRGGR